MSTGDLQTVAWLYHDGQEGVVPTGPTASITHSMLFSTARLPTYRNETPLVLRTDALARIEALERERADTREQCRFNTGIRMAAEQRAQAAEAERNAALAALREIHDIAGGECFEYRQIALRALAAQEGAKT